MVFGSISPILLSLSISEAGVVKLIGWLRAPASSSQTCTGSARQRGAIASVVFRLKCGAILPRTSDAQMKISSRFNLLKGYQYKKGKLRTLNYTSNQRTIPFKRCDVKIPSCFGCSGGQVAREPGEQVIVTKIQGSTKMDSDLERPQHLRRLSVPGTETSHRLMAGTIRDLSSGLES